jgi:hypothetical protein
MVSTYEIDRESFWDMLIKYMPILFKKKEPKKQEKPDITKTKNSTYKNNYQEKRLISNYISTIGTYLNKRMKAINDFTDKVPGKFMKTLPKSVMGGILGFTYLGDNSVTRRDDLAGDFAYEVDVHECIHTPDEYETRRITEWMISEDRDGYIR